MTTIEPKTDWTDQEKWVWKKLRSGQNANLNEYDSLSKGPWLSSKWFNPKKDEDFKDDNKWKNRIISSEFLETILLDEPYKGELTRKGVTIIGAWFKDNIDLSFAPVKHFFGLAQCRFESHVNLTSLKASSAISFDSSKFATATLLEARISGQLNLSGSTFSNKLDMNGLQVDSSLFMHNGATFSEVDLMSAKIGGQLTMTGSTFSGAVDMDSLQVDGSLSMRDGATFSEINLVSAKIGGQLTMTGSTFSAKLDMDGLQVGSSLFMRDGATFSEVNLVSSQIGGELRMDGSTFSGEINMDSMRLGSHLFVRKATFEKPIELIFAKIEGHLILRGSVLNTLNLTGTTIKGDLALGLDEDSVPKWAKGSRLMLRNTKVGALIVTKTSWPDDIDLVGFQYSRLGGYFEEGEPAMNVAKIDWFEDWLKKQKTFSPQPYEQLAAVLREEGREQKARDILYAKRERQRLEEEHTQWRSVFLWIMKYVIGYGYRIHRVGGWVLAFTLIGAYVLYASGEGAAHGMPLGLSYSLDMLLPIIKLRGFHYTFDLGGWAQYYFYFHKMVGYILASFLVAGLSGLTK